MHHVGVSIFFDSNGNVVIIPVLRDDFGVGRQSSEFFKLNKGWKIIELEKIVMEAIEVSEKNEEKIYKDHIWTEATGIQGFSAFSKRYKLISLSYWQNENTYNIINKKRLKNGAYGLN